MHSSERHHRRYSARRGVGASPRKHPETLHTSCAVHCSMRAHRLASAKEHRRSFKSRHAMVGANLAARVIDKTEALHTLAFSRETVVYQPAMPGPCPIKVSARCDAVNQPCGGAMERQLSRARSYFGRMTQSNEGHTYARMPCTMPTSPFCRASGEDHARSGICVTPVAVCPCKLSTIPPGGLRGTVRTKPRRRHAVLHLSGPSVALWQWRRSAIHPSWFTATSVKADILLGLCQRWRRSLPGRGRRVLPDR